MKVHPQFEIKVAQSKVERKRYTEKRNSIIATITTTILSVSESSIEERSLVLGSFLLLTVLHFPKPIESEDKYNTMSFRCIHSPRNTVTEFVGVLASQPGGGRTNGGPTLIWHSSFSWEV